MKSSVSSRREKQSPSNAGPTPRGKTVRYTLDARNPPALAAEQIARLKRIADLPDAKIDFSDAPALGEKAWEQAVQRGFYRPVKQQVTLRLDSGVIDWFKIHAKDGRGYQTDINKALREHIAAAERRPVRKKTG